MQPTVDLRRIGGAATHALGELSELLAFKQFTSSHTTVSAIKKGALCRTLFVCGDGGI